MEDEDFAALLDEYEQSAPMPRRRNLPKVGDMVRGQVISVGREAAFVALGAKAEGLLELEQITDADGNVTVQPGDTVEARVVELRGDTPVLRTSMGRGPDARAELAQAHEHQIPVEGLVTAVNKGGVEVQVAGTRAFCPMSQLDNRYVEDPASFVGQKLTFRITRYEVGRGTPNIVLSRRALLEEEAAVRAAETRATLHAGAVLAGTVTTIKPYGAFVDIGGIEGLLPISELSFARVDQTSDILTVGQRLEVQVLKVEKTGDAKRPEKISLSLKALANDPWDEVDRRFGQGGRVRGTVTRLQAFGAFVELLPGVEGMVHISELGAGRRIQHPREVVRVGEEVEVQVLSVDRERRRISLSMAAVARSEEAAAEAEAMREMPSSPRSLGTFADLLKGK